MKINTKKNIITADQYKKVSKSFPRKHVFRLGFDSGFFSEYNNMILAMVYCILNKIDFTINSKYANFKTKLGWQDYFTPFFNEDSRFFHKKYNYRPYSTIQSKKAETFFKWFYRLDYLTQDIWTDFRSKLDINQEYSIPELNFHGTLLQACSQFVFLTWNLKPEIKTNINEFLLKLNLPNDYVGIHVRRGDKFSETKEFYHLEQYLSLVESKTPIRNLFISSDDYNVILELQKVQKWNVFHAIPQNNAGYTQDVFNSMDPMNKFKDLVDLFCNVQALCNSSIFVGTCNSNVGMFVGMHRTGQNTYYIDSDQWRVW